MEKRWGLTIPLDGHRLHQHQDLFREMVDLGYTDAWSAETDGADGFTPLALAAAWSPELRLGVAIIPVYTRGPATLASSVAALADAAPGRFVMGIGSSSNVIVERWNDIPFEQPYQRVRDTLRFLRKTLAGEKVKEEFETFSVGGFRPSLVPEQTPPLLVAALRPGMLALAGREGDGAIINWLSPTDVTRVAPIVHEAAEGAPREIAARIFVAPTTDRDTVMGLGKYAIAAYLNVPVYAEFHRWLGREDVLGDMWRLWADGDRSGALAAIPDAVVDDLIVHGPPEACRERIREYLDNGVDTAALAILPFPGIDAHQAMRDLAP